MNFLAHLAFSGKEEDVMIGNFVADFVKGKKAFETQSFWVQKGIQLHRQIDAFTDTHHITHELVALLRPQALKYATVVIDILYDHFLARHFELFFGKKLTDFAQNTYEILAQHLDILPKKLQEMFPYMRTENWLVRYGDDATQDFYGLRRSLEGLQRRSLYAQDLVKCLDVLKENYEIFDQKSIIFLTEIQDFCEEYRVNNF